MSATEHAGAGLYAPEAGPRAAVDTSRDPAVARASALRVLEAAGVSPALARRSS